MSLFSTFKRRRKHTHTLRVFSTNDYSISVCPYARVSAAAEKSSTKERTRRNEIAKRINEGRKKKREKKRKSWSRAYARLASEKNHEAGNRRAQRNDILAKALTTRRATVFKAWTLFHDVSSREWQKRKEGHAK